MKQRFGQRACLFGAVLFAASTTVIADEPSHDQPLHVRIDRMIERSHVGPFSAIAADAEFVRRVYLDLIGMIPSAGDVLAFVGDQSPGKREALVGRLLDDPRHARHMAQVFDVALMERRADKHVKTPEWHEYLYASFLENKPYNQLAAEILAADGVDAKMRPAAKFYLDRDGETNKLTRDVGRMFFGMDLQCAQCHDHPIIDDYLQSDYYGIFAFLNRSFLFADKKAKQTFFAEKAEGVVEFTSVFTGEKGKTGPRLPGGQVIDEPVFEKDDQYKVKPAKDVMPVPKYSRRKRLAELATDGTNRAFSRNIANRLWAHMMGRGLVDPVDLLHSDNPPTHPELLELLADELVKMKFDVKAFLRELARTQVYQRKIDLPADLEEQAAEVANRLPGLDAELVKVIAAFEQSKQAVTEARGQLAKAEQALAPLADELAKLDATLTEMEKKAAEAAQAVAKSRQLLNEQRQTEKLLAEAAAKAQEAAQRLADDKELADAAAKFAARSKQWTEDVAALAQTLAGREEANNQAQQSLAAAQDQRDAATHKLDESKQAVEAAKQRLAAATEQNNASQQSVARSERALAAATALIEYKPDDSEAYSQFAELWTEQLATRALKPLTPEQLAWSIMQAVGIIEREQAAAGAAFDKKNPPSDNGEKTADDDLRKRSREIEKAVYEKLKGNVTAFVTLFAAGAGQPQQDFFATADQALFFSNGALVRGWLAPSGGNLTDRAVKLEDPQAVAEDIYVSVLNRFPSDEETAAVVEHLAAQPDAKATAVQEIVWALLTSAEFRFNH